MNTCYVVAVGRRAGVSAEETRCALLAATMKVLRSKGYEGTRVAEIAREAGLTSGAIYNHFSSKSELLTAAINEQGPGAISDLMRSGDDVSVLDAFGHIGRVMPRRAHVLAPIVLELVATAARDRKVGQVVRSEFAGREHDAADMLRLGQNAGEVDPEIDAEALARFTTMLGLGSIVAAALDLKPIDDSAWAAVIDRMLHAVTPQGEPA